MASSFGPRASVILSLSVFGAASPSKPACSSRSRAFTPMRSLQNTIRNRRAVTSAPGVFLSHGFQNEAHQLRSSLTTRSAIEDSRQLDTLVDLPELSMDYGDDEGEFDMLLEPPAFVIKDPSLPPSDEELSNENILRIILLESTDQETNELVWRCLGYRYDHDIDDWDSSLVFPKWREKFPTPPDLIGVRRIYTKEVDQPVLRANQALVRSIPMDFKNGIRNHLFGLKGFFGLKMEGLTPNKTRRAQCANWLLYYRDALHGKSINQLRAEREKRRESEASEAQERPDLDVSGQKNLEARRAGQSARLASAPSPPQA